MSELILFLVLGINVITLTIVFLVFKRNKDITDHLGSSMKQVEIGQKEVESIQDNFKKTLEEIIAKDRQVVENTTNNIIRYYEDTVKSMTQNYNANSQKLSGVLNEDLQKHLAKIGENIAEQGRDISKVFAIELQAALKKTDKQLEEYKAEREKEIESRLYQLVEEAAKNIMSRSLNVTEHQELVIKALEQAKRDKFFA